ncbi:hypothetical protein DO71_3864 [Burkholderia pseudomallei]|uniref:hypothetical protein n=1 Tax=Burkholderia pseudomallei TaxID=28450 RepID=UPI00051025D7|nr:hypothetical protein [Burkholderia pseudomallei]KGC81768.1 hypothetical protein DO71_3864 [Burkholderia pseudomallei]KGV19064.1 hypothetical protein X891_4799 [Burkholderia pseudomallei TSV 43]KGV31579.1 hypothetical protein X893_3466 [Burkholderia pseudomallei TSV 31]
MVTYVRLSGTRLFLPASRAGDPAHARIAFVEHAGQKLPDTIDPSTSLARGAICLFPELTPVIASIAADRIAAALDANGGTEIAIALFTAALELRRNELVLASPAGVLTTGVDLLLGVSQGDNATGNDGWVSYFKSGGQLRGVTGALMVSFSQPDKRFGLRVAPSGSAIPLASNDLNYRMELDGPQRGVFRFQLDVDGAAADQLGIGMRYFELTAAAPPRANVVAHHFPLYAIGARERFEFALDLAAPYEEEILSITTTMPRSMVYPPATPLLSHLHAIGGQDVVLERAANDRAIGLRLAKSPIVYSPTLGIAPEISHALTPHGMFRVKSDSHSTKPLRVGLGLSNLENILIDANAGDTLTFEYGPALIDPAPGLSPADELKPGSGNCRTAWARFVPGSGSSRPLAIDPEGMPGYVGDVQTPMYFRSTRFDAIAGAFPMVPLLGLVSAAGSSVASRLQVEREVLSRVRRGMAESHSARLTRSWMASNPEVARTPQGYLAERAAEGEPWTTITFGRTARREESDPAAAGPGTPFAISATTPDAQALLARLLTGNRLFLVTTQGALSRAGFDSGLLSAIVMGGWTAALGSDAIVIVKHDDRSVEQLIQDQKNWTATATVCPPADAARAAAKVRDALASPGELFAPLQCRLKDPNWNGVIILDAWLGQLPEQLASLSPGLPTPLPIHHVGLDLSAIVASPSNSAWAPAVFGVLNYTAGPGAKPAVSDVMSMQVTRLVLRVENDAVDRFECTVRLCVSKIFDVGPLPDGGGKPKFVDLEGKYETRIDAGGNKRESYRFVALAEDGPILKLDFSTPSIVEGVTLDRIELLTVKENGNPSGRFVLDGAIKFGKVGDMDLLGIDALKFSSLGINFDLSSFHVDLDYPSISFDLDGFNRGEIQRRAGSFFSNFALKLRGFHVGDLSLPKLGFLDLGIKPPMGFGLSSDFRFGFTFDLDLGSLGSLAKKLERFKLQLMIGWKPRFPGSLADLFAIGFRIDLGEGAGGIDLGIEGVARLTAEKFNLKKVAAPSEVPGGEDIMVLSANDCVLEVLGQRLPTAEDQHFALFLFGRLGSGIFERPGWFASFKDDIPTAPIALSRISLAQRVDVEFDKLESTKQAVDWLDAQLTFKPGDEDRFVRFASTGGTLRYAPDREWFAAAKGDFFEFARIAVLLRDPDLYGIYLAILGSDPKNPLFELDFLYQKLADGMGRFVVELLPPEALRTVELGAVSLTLGVIHAELYTDGGFLIQFGSDGGADQDWSKAFVAQGGPFIGKGGFFVGRVPRQAVPALVGNNVGSVFVAGLAIRIGLGREFERGPIKAGLSVSVFGRVQGAVARLTTGSSYVVAMTGEIGILAEIEGSVDLRIVRARLLIRVWVGAGLVLVTGQPVLLFCEAGVEVSVEVEIGRIRVFGHTIRITIHLSYSTRLRFEWELPAKVPGLPALAPAVLTRRAASTSPWTVPTAVALGVMPAPMQLRLVVDACRTDAGGRAVPLVVWLENDGVNAGQAPFRTLGDALVAWAVLRLSPGAPDASKVAIAKTTSGAGVTIEAIRAELRGLDGVDPAILSGFLQVICSGSRLDPVTDGGTVTGYAFPAPPGLVFDLGGTAIDLAATAVMDDAEAGAIVAHLDGQFAEISSTASVAPAVGGPMLALSTRLFREWCQLLALVTLETLDQFFDAGGDVTATIPLGTLQGKLRAADWQNIAGRAGRLFHGGLRAIDGIDYKPLLELAGLLLPVPATVKMSLSMMRTGASAWLTVDPRALELDGSAIADLGAATPIIAATPDLNAPTTRMVPRAFPLSGWTHVRPGDAAPAQSVLLDLSVDLRHQLSRSASNIFPEELTFQSRDATSVGQPSGPPVLLKSAVRTLVFSMAVERIALGAPTGTPQRYIPNCFQVAGTSEPERRGLDALLANLTDSPAWLAGCTIDIGWRVSNGPNAGSLVRPAVAPGEVLLARSTVSVERRPFPTLHAFSTAPAAPDDIFRATMDPADHHAFLLLLQRAALVNVGGTYLIVPDALAASMSALFGDTNQTQVVFTVHYDSAAAVPSAAVNAVEIRDAGDLAALEPVGGRSQVVIAKVTDAVAEQKYTELPGLVEAVALRPPGTELLRLWRKAPDRLPDATPQVDLAANLLERQFDMLEFEIVDADGTMLLPFDQCLPQASEAAVPDETPEPVRSWLQTESKAMGFGEKDHRYDLLLPFAALIARKGLGPGPYAGIGRTFRVRLGWRDIYGNRFGPFGTTLLVPLTYHDPLVPLEAWPGVRASFSPGVAGSRAIQVKLDVEPADLSGAAANKLAADGLKRVIDQLGGPGIGISLACGLGTLRSGVVSTTAFLNYLNAVHVWLSGGPNMPKPLQLDVVVAQPTDAAFSPLTISLDIRRDPAFVSRAAVSGVGSISCPIKPDVDASAGAQGRQAFATSFQGAFSDAGRPPLVWAAIGADDFGVTTWWSVDARVFPTGAAGDGRAFAPPPIALSPMSAEVFPPLLDPNGSFEKGDERHRSVRGHDRDADELLRLFLARIDEFLSPLNAPVTARAVSSIAGRPTPLERIARAKATLLGPGEPPASVLLAKLTGIRPEDDDPSCLDEALRTMRDACASDLSRYGNVASVVVVPLRSNSPAGWTAGQPRPKLYGQLKFGDGTTTPAFRTLTRGIAMKDGQMALGIALIPDDNTTTIDLAKPGSPYYVFTNLERLIETGGPGEQLSPSRWVTLVPVDVPAGATSQALPTVDLAWKGKLSAPAPLRQVPKPAILSSPMVAPYDGDPTTSYLQAVSAARRWSFGFELSAEFMVHDQYCGRMIYNADLHGSAISTATPAAPLFPGLFELLLAFEARTAPYWSVIATEADRRASGRDPASEHRFNNACERFAEAVEEVLGGFSKPLLLGMVDPLIDDRFVITDVVHGKGRRTQIAYRDHLAPGDPPATPHAGEGAPNITIRQLIGADSFDGVKGTVHPLTTTFDFASAETAPPRRYLEVGRLDSVALQSVWTSASIRRNAIIAQIKSMFVYRTPEVYLQQVLVPNLVRRASIRFSDLKAETLAARLQHALSPVFSGQARDCPIQIRFDYESARIVDMLERAGLPADQKFTPEPDPKVQFAGIQVGSQPGAWTVARLAGDAAAALLQQFAQAPVDARGRLVVAVTLRTGDGIGQPLLQLKRLLVPLSGLADLP